MYKDEMWYRNWSRSIDARRDDMTDKQWDKFNIPYMLKLGHRVKNFSERCTACRDFQYPLTRLEEELQELPDSKAQRQYQSKILGLITDHMVKEHRIAPPNYYVKKMLKYGIILGITVGLIVVIFVTGNLLHIPIAMVLGVALAESYGFAEDNRHKQEKRLL